MPPKKATGAVKKTTAPHASYRDMIKDAVVNLKERNGSSRQAIKKYVSANNKINVASQATFDAQFNKAIKAGVEKGEFLQPKGPSGPLKLAKKAPAPKAAPKTAAKAAPKTTTKKTTTKTTTTKAAPKKAAPKKAAAKPGPKPGVKKAAATTTKKAVGRPKANSGTD